MLRKSQRLLTKRVNEVITTGKIAQSSLFTLRFIVSGRSHVAAVAPVRVAKTAVLRNRTRRRIYVAVRPILKEIQITHDIVLIAKSPALQADTARLTQDIRDLFVKARIIS